MTSSEKESGPVKPRRGGKRSDRAGTFRRLQALRTLDAGKFGNTPPLPMAMLPVPGGEVTRMTTLPTELQLELVA